tara:strand:- start:463 stop:1071 length:609 start_codon:yes stop_codon:yes gene_type:complete
MDVYISLGYKCSPRGAIKNVYGFSKKNGYKSCPFDLCIAPFNALCKILENDFSTFFDGLKIIEWENGNGDRSKSGPGNTAITNKCGIIFNHEGGGHSHLFKVGRNDDTFYSKNNFKEFRIRYARRIQNFQNIFKNSNNIIFVYTGNEFKEDIIRKIIEKTYGHKIIKFIKIPTHNTIGAFPEPAEVTYKRWLRTGSCSTNGD